MSVNPPLKYGGRREKSPKPNKKKKYVAEVGMFRGNGLSDD
jgi:hypothetical protein